MEIYAAQYSACIYESDFATISLHLSKEGAEQAIAEDQKTRFTISEEEQAEILAVCKNLDAFKQQPYQQYRIETFEVLP